MEYLIIAGIIIFFIFISSSKKKNKDTNSSESSVEIKTSKNLFLETDNSPKRTKSGTIIFPQENFKVREKRLINYLDKRNFGIMGDQSEVLGTIDYLKEYLEYKKTVNLEDFKSLENLEWAFSEFLINKISKLNFWATIQLIYSYRAEQELKNKNIEKSIEFQRISKQYEWYSIVYVFEYWTHKNGKQMSPKTAEINSRDGCCRDCTRKKRVKSEDAFKNLENKIIPDKNCSLNRCKCRFSLTETDYNKLDKIRYGW